MGWDGPWNSAGGHGSKPQSAQEWVGDDEQDLPSGYVKIAIENGHRNSEFSH